ncbi:MAG: 16S rRNA (uracil(1498)-N(3))-methyltransferase, partial [Arenimonas sp.]|nr:16S rRNA (uracil(1498)-N(3))-methyltransferase [Arenimonas sp.]
MRTIRSYVDAPLSPGATVTLSELASGHLVRVLRLGVGDAVVLFNGDGHDYAARLVSLGKRGAEAEVLSSAAVANESPLGLTLA